MFKNAALFINGNRIMRNVNVEWDDEEIRVLNRSTKAVMATHEIVETAASEDKTMAWDIKDQRGALIRLVAQTGCGCSGMNPYEEFEDYSGSVTRK